MGLGRLQLWSSRNEENGQSPTAILKFAVDAFQLEPNHGCLVAGEWPTSKGEVEFCHWQRKFVDGGHDPPQLFFVLLRKPTSLHSTVSDLCTSVWLPKKDARTREA